MNSPTISQLIFVYIIIVLSAVFHEYAHAFVAYKLGDTTAKDQGRLTLNPLKHLDPLGTVIIPILLLFTAGTFIGWAKPVPYNPYNLRDKKHGSLKVGLAGPLANIIIALIFAVIARIIIGYFLMSDGLIIFVQLLVFIVSVNVLLALFNLIPLPPLDGSKIIMDLFPRQYRYFEQLGFIGLLLALFIAFAVLAPLSQIIVGVLIG